MLLVVDVLCVAIAALLKLFAHVCVFVVSLCAFVCFVCFLFLRLAAQGTCMTVVHDALHSSRITLDFATIAASLEFSACCFLQLYGPDSCRHGAECGTVQLLI